MKSFHYDIQSKSYIYYFIYVNTETKKEEDHLTATKIFFANYKLTSTTGPVTKNWL